MNIIIHFLFPLPLNLIFFVYMFINSLALSFSWFPLLFVLRGIYMLVFLKGLKSLYMSIAESYDVDKC
jgi:hypothetical protein